jgi:hypothetical protein
VNDDADTEVAVGVSEVLVGLVGLASAVVTVDAGANDASAANNAYFASGLPA